MAAGGGIGIVRDEHHGGAKLAMQIVKEAKNFVAGFRVEISGGLVCQQQRRIENESAGDGDALAFAAGKFVWQMASTRAETDAIEKFRGAQFGFAAAQSLQAQRERCIFQSAQRRQQIESLKNHANFFTARASAKVV